MRLTPVEDDPANWKAHEMLAQENEWTIDISDYISDLNRALKHWKLQNGPTFKPFTQADFEVGPKLKAILTNGLSDLEVGRGFFRLRGLLNVTNSLISEKDMYIMSQNGMIKKEG